jgi:predicted nucleic acid-binding protein
VDRTEGGRLQAQLAAHSLIALDTSVLIYFLEGHVIFGGVAERALRAVQDGQIEALFSSVGLMELLVRPLAEARPDVADEHEALLRQVPHLRVVPFNGDAHRRAAELRARYGLRPPDAMLMGSALAEGATAYLTNDSRLRAVAELAVLLLSEFVPSDTEVDGTRMT